MNLDAQQSLVGHATPFREWARRYREATAQPGFYPAVAQSFLAFLGSVVVSFFAIGYATEHASNSVSDLILSNIPALDVDGFFVWGSLLLVLSILLLLLLNPKRIPFTLYSLAVFYVIRSAFTILTHIGPYPIETDYAYNLGVLAGRFLTGKDMFFSGHTGLPFLIALIYWRYPGVRLIFIGWSVLMAAIVLLGHLHYSIDVAAAYFITYSIFCLCERFFPRERALFYLKIEPTN